MTPDHLNAWPGQMKKTVLKDADAKNGLRNHPAIVEVLQEVMNPNPNPKIAKGNRHHS